MPSPQRGFPSRREFLAATVGASAGLLGAAAAGAVAGPGRLEVLSDSVVAAGAVTDLKLRFTPETPLRPGSRLWLFYDTRQGAQPPDIAGDAAKNRVVVEVGADPPPGVALQAPEIPRTLDLFPTAPEFLHLIEATFANPIASGVPIDIGIEKWIGPQAPIEAFQFWLVVDARGEWDFESIDFRRYRRFVHRAGAIRVRTDELMQQTLIAAIRVTGEPPAIPNARTRKTPGIYWGEFHGMVFNQRPLEDYYRYARHVSRLDFCAPLWFSYNTCVGDVWSRVQDAARRHSQPGEFVAIAGFECGTPPDDSHRCVLFPDARDVPPIFCESRPPAQEPFFQQRLHPQTRICRSTDELYALVAQYGGIVTGHFHTLSYEREVLAELYQKNLERPDLEEQRLYQLLRDGKRFALAATSDTHDSMPGNPYPEPHLPMPAGVTGVLADELTAESLFAAVRERRTIATTGARIRMEFGCHDQRMGTALPLESERAFHVHIDGTDRLESVELLRNGEPLQRWTPETAEFAVDAADPDAKATAFYLVRVKQHDGHQGWTSPLWFG